MAAPMVKPWTELQHRMAERFCSKVEEAQHVLPRHLQAGPEIIPDLPQSGTDIHTEPIYWNLPCGRIICYSIAQLRNLPEDELLPYDSVGAHMELANKKPF